MPGRAATVEQWAAATGHAGEDLATTLTAARIWCNAAQSNASYSKVDRLTRWGVTTMGRLLS